MKKRTILLVTAVLCAFLVGALVGCSQPATPESQEPEALTAPTLQPANHVGRFYEGGAENCYTCHGATQGDNPQMKTARIVPENHYVEGSYDSMAFDTTRYQCITCHPVSQE